MRWGMETCPFLFIRGNKKSLHLGYKAYRKQYFSILLLPFVPSDTAKIADSRDTTKYFL